MWKFLAPSLMLRLKMRPTLPVVSLLSPKPSAAVSGIHNFTMSRKKAILRVLIGFAQMTGAIFCALAYQREGASTLFFIGLITTLSFVAISLIVFKKDG